MAAMRLAVFDADAPPALAFLVSAGKLGIPVDVYSHQAFPPARASRFCHRFHRAPDPHDLRAFLPWLSARVDAGEITCIAPTSDLIAFAITEVMDRLPAAVARALPTTAQALSVLFKERMTVVPGIPLALPWTVTPSSEEEARDLADTYRYPAVIKPRSHVHAPWVRGAVVEDAAALRATYARAPAVPATADVVARFPGLDLPVVQELIPATELRSVSGVVEDGELALAGASVKELAWPPPLGVGLIFSSVDLDDTARDAARFAGATLGQGLVEIEYVRDPRDGRHLVFDVNPRAFGQIRLDIAQGRDLPARWLARAFDRPREVPSSTTRTGWQHSIPLAIARGTALVMGPDRGAAARALVDDARAGRTDIVFDTKDPLPAALYVGRMFRHPGGLLRPFVREALKARRRRR